MKKGYFIFSFDCELGWGYFDKFQANRLNPRRIFSYKAQRERKYINIILDMLDEFEIKTTWAIVGHLMQKNRDSEHLKLSAKGGSAFGGEWISYLAKEYPELFYGEDIVDAILSKKVKHEIAFHGFTHKIFENMSLEEAEKELQEWKREGKKKNIIPKTVIFPRNKIGFLELFRKQGFIYYRGEESVPKIHSLKYIGKIIKTVDYILGLSTPPVYELQKASGLINLPASQFFFGFNHRVEKFLDALNLEQLRIRRMIKGVKKASWERKIIHIWTHPCQFRNAKDIAKLRYLLYNVSKEIKRGRLQAVGMSDLVIGEPAK